jgi:TonB-dependent SusC/RagA subfamily outer membrane receptor
MLPRDRVTGSVSSVSGERLARNTRAVRVEELLQGRVAGVQVIRLANGGYRVRIRGAAGEGEPLFVVDGMPVHALYPGAALNGINPADVVRIDVLKDAGSTAIYGSRGAHGVILITTRRPGT